MIAANNLELKPGTTASNKCDTNADTCCLGKNFVILEYTRRTADVYTYEKSLKPIKGVPIVNSATAWNEPVTQHTYILVINEALYYGTKLDHSLINPNQVRSYGINFWDNPFDKEKGLRIEIDYSVDITMQTKGTEVYFKTWLPTEVELRYCPKLQLTSRSERKPTTASLNNTTTNNREDRP